MKRRRKKKRKKKKKRKRKKRRRKKKKELSRGSSCFPSGKRLNTTTIRQQTDYFLLATSFTL